MAAEAKRVKRDLAAEAEGMEEAIWVCLEKARRWKCSVLSKLRYCASTRE